MIDWANAISTASAAISLAKDLKDIDASFDLSSMKAKAATLYSDLADVKMALADAREEAREHEAEIARLKSAFEFRGTLVEYRGYKYEPLPGGKPKGWPFCPRCEQNKGRFYRLVHSPSGYRGDCHCPECKTTYSAVESFGWE